MGEKRFLWIKVFIQGERKQVKSKTKYLSISTSYKYFQKQNEAPCKVNLIKFLLSKS